jgi:cation transport protein ChaC
VRGSLNARPITRAEIGGGAIEDMIKGRDPDLVPLTDEERQQALDRIMARHPAGSDLWVFGYGSLLWNPAIRVAETKVVRLYGFHRRLCLVTRVARGTPARPGLQLGLDCGGGCVGVGLRVRAADVAAELALLLRRELVDDAYRPAWVTVRADDGRQWPAVTFVMNRWHRRYAPKMPDEQVARMVALAAGQFGTCLDYVEETVAALRRLGIRDRALERLAVHAARLADENGNAAGTAAVTAVGQATAQ